MAESVILDPSAVAIGRVELDITQHVAEGGPDWGDAAIEAYLADAQLGQIPVDFRVPSRTITIPLLLRDQSGGLTFEQARAKIQQKVSLFQREGGWLRRNTAIGPVYADITGATLKLGGGTAQALWGVDADALLTLTAVPDFYGNEVAGSVRSSRTGESELILLLGASHKQTILDLSPALYWRLGASGITDQSGNARNGTAGGGVTVGGYSSDALVNDSDAATDFDGTDDRITSSYNPFANGSDRTFSGWAYRDTSSSIDTLFGSDTVTAGAWVRLQLASGSNDVIFTVNGGTNQVTWTAAWPGNSQWVNWALTFQESFDVAELFINGVSQGTRTVTQAYNATPGNFEVGARSGTSDPFDGKQDEVAVFTRSLTKHEIQQLYRAGISDPPVTGNHPARARIIVTELDGKAQQGLLWGIRSRHYDDAPTAKLAYDAEELTPISPAGADVHTGASNGVEVQVGYVPGSWTALLSTDLENDAGALTHVGSYRVLARIRSLTDEVFVRLAWDVGDLMLPTINTAVQLSGTGDTYEIVDLGEVRIDRAPLGVHRWRGVIQALATLSAQEFGIDRLWFQPIDESAGLVTAPISSTPGLFTADASDDFVQSPGNLTGQGLNTGGIWTYATGDADDFVVDASLGMAKRTSTNDTDARFVYANGPTFTNLVAQIDYSGGTPARNYLLFRFVDSNNYAFVFVLPDYTGPGVAYLGFRKVVAGVMTDLSGTFETTLPIGTDWQTLRVMALANGKAYAWLSPQGSGSSSGPALLSAFDTTLRTGGALASGKVGFGDEYTDVISRTTYYDNFSAWTPEADAVLFGNKSAELRFDGMFREHTDSGGYFAPISQIVGDLPRLPPAGLEQRPVEVLLKGSESDFNKNADLSISRISAQVLYRPSYLFVPES